MPHTLVAVSIRSRRESCMIGSESMSNQPSIVGSIAWIMGSTAASSRLQIAASVFSMKVSRSCSAMARLASSVKPIIVAGTLKIAPISRRLSLRCSRNCMSADEIAGFSSLSPPPMMIGRSAVPAMRLRSRSAARTCSRCSLLSH